MPVAIDEYMFPRWVKTEERYPWVSDRNHKYRNLTINPRHPVGRYNGNIDEGLGWKAPGYNVNHNSTAIERVNIGVDTTESTFRSH